MRRLATSFTALSMLAALATANLAQTKPVQSLQGGYLGLANFGVGTTPFAVQLEIDNQTNRGFTGALGYTSVQSPFIEVLSVKGTIAASGNCTIQADSDDAKATLKLGWVNFGGGAAVLVGTHSLMGDGSVRFQGPIALLRPFRDLDVRWDEGSAVATLQSHTGGVNFGVPVDFLQGGEGLFGAVVTLDRETFRLLGTSNVAGQVVAVGVSESFILTITGDVKVNARGEPIAVDGAYRIQSAAGKELDAGIIAILIG